MAFRLKRIEELFNCFKLQNSHKLYEDAFGQDFVNMNGARFSAFSHVSGLPDLWFDLLKKICSTSCLVSCLTLIFLVAFFSMLPLQCGRKKLNSRGQGSGVGG